MKLYCLPENRCYVTQCSTTAILYFPIIIVMSQRVLKEIITTINTLNAVQLTGKSIITVHGDEKYTSVSTLVASIGLLQL